MPTENGLPRYVSKDTKSGNYQYWRRPPIGVKGSAFIRSFKTKDRKTVWAMWPPIHAEAEEYFARLASGRTIPDKVLHDHAWAMVAGNLFGPDAGKINGVLTSEIEFVRSFDETNRKDPELRGATDADFRRLYELTMDLYHKSEAHRLGKAIKAATNHQQALQSVSSVVVPVAKPDAFTLQRAYDEAWKPAKTRGKNTVTEVGRYVSEFEALNGTLDLGSYTRAHWAAWRANCLKVHGPGPTAFKRFSMMKTVVHESIRAGLFERRHFAGQDVSMTKPDRNKLRNEGWLQDELTEFFAAPVFRGAKDMTRRLTILGT